MSNHNFELFKHENYNIKGFKPFQTGYGYYGDAMNTIPTGEGYWPTLA